MATTTPNFGWSVPTSTDLVKDGATAIELLGDSIDASLVDLKGGTTGQVLAKASNTDLDFTFVTVDDTNAIQNAIVDAKGDLIAATAADTPARLAVGANGTVLTADSAEATGLKWATVASGPAFSVYLAANQNVTGSTWTKVTFNTETFDTASNFDSTTNYRFTPTTAGYYQINLTIQCQSNFNVQAQGAIYKNGSAYLVSSVAQADQGIGSKDLSAIIYFNGSTDYVEGYGNIDTGGGPRFNGGSTLTQFSGVWIRS